MLHTQTPRGCTCRRDNQRPGSCDYCTDRGDHLAEQEELLELAITDGLLIPDGTGGYVMTDAGKEEMITASEWTRRMLVDVEF